LALVNFFGIVENRSVFQMKHNSIRHWTWSFPCPTTPKSSA